MAGTQGLTLSRFSSAAEAHRQFPTLAERGPNGDSLKGAVCTLTFFLSSRSRPVCIWGVPCC